MRLYLVRHAEAAPGSPDELRPLTEAGRRRARELGQHLAAEGPLDVVLCSPLLRARETGLALARAANVDDLVVEAALAPGVTAESLVAAVAGRGDRVVAIGHQPDLSRIATVLTGAEVPFAPGDVLAIELAS